MADPNFGIDPASLGAQPSDPLPALPPPSQSPMYRALGFATTPSADGTPVATPTDGPASDPNAALYPPDPNANPQIDIDPIAPLTKSMAVKAGTSGGTSSSSKGVIGGASTVNGIFATADARNAQAATDMQAVGDKEKGQIAGDVANEADAVTQTAIEEHKFYAAQADAQLKISAVQRGAADLQLQADANSKVIQANYINQYRQQLAGVAAMASASGNPLETMNAGGILGLGVAQFAQGFLAARGINIDVSGQIDRWVDRSLREHQQQVENARGAAQDTLHLYDIARQSSADDAEARQRYTGMVIAGMTSSIQANADRFRSNAADSQAKLTIAQLQLKGHELEQTIGNNIYDRTFKMQSMNIQEATAKVTALTTQQATAAHYADIAERREARKEAQANKGASGVSYITDPITNKPIGRITKGTVNDDKRAGEVSTKRAFFSDLHGEMKKLMGYQQSLGDRSRLGETISKAEDPEYRRMQESRARIVMIFGKMVSGGAITEDESKRFQDLVPGESAWQKGTNYGVLNDFDDSLRASFQHTVDANTDTNVNPDGSIGYQQGEVKGVQTPGVVDPDGVKASGAFNDGKPRELTQTDKSTAMMKDDKERGSTVASRALEDQVDPNFEHHTEHVTTTHISQAWLDGMKDKGDRVKEAEPGWAVAMDHKATMAAAGNEDAKAVLADMAKGGDFSETRRDYARSLMSGLDKPQELLNKLTTFSKGEQRPLNTEDQPGEMWAP